MNELDELFSQLNTFWNNDNGDSRYKGEDPRCEDIQNEILKKLSAMSDEEIKKVLAKIPDEQLEQIRFILECMEDDRPCVKIFMRDD